MDICHCPGAAVAIVQDTTIRCSGLYEQSTITHVPIDVPYSVSHVSKSLHLSSPKSSKQSPVERKNKVTDYLPGFWIRSREYHLGDDWSYSFHSSGLPYHSFTNLVEWCIRLLRSSPLFKTFICKGASEKNMPIKTPSYAMIGVYWKKQLTKILPPNCSMKSWSTPLHMPDLLFTYASIHDGKDMVLPHRPDTSGTYFQPTEISDKYYNTISAGGINASISDRVFGWKCYRQLSSCYFKDLIRYFLNRSFVRRQTGGIIIIGQGLKTPIMLKGCVSSTTVIIIGIIL